MVTTSTRRHQVIEMKEAGLTYAEIGRRLGVTRERVRQIVNWKPTPQKPALESKAMLTVSDVARLLNVHGNTVRQWSNKGILKTLRLGTRGDRRFWRRDIDNLLQEFSGRTNEPEPINHPHRPVDLPEFRDYARQKYPDVLDEDLITMIEDLIERGRRHRPSPVI